MHQPRPRRGNHEGTVRQRAPGRWEGVVQLDGSRYRVTASTQAEARRLLQDLLMKHGLGELAKPSNTKTGDWLAQWLVEGAPAWKPKTHHGYESIVRVYLEPAFGSVRLQRLTATTIATQFATWRAEGHGSAALNAFRVLARSLTVAVHRGLIGRNPCDMLEAPKVARRRPALWSPAQARAFLEACEPDTFGTLWTVLLGTGCRLGEALALRWEDANLDTGVVTITRSLTELHGEYIETTPKTDAGTRALVLPKRAVALLRRWKVRQAAHRLATGPAWPQTGRIITDASGATPSTGRVSHAFHKATNDAELPRIRIHDLRHLHASLLLANGLELPAVSARLGHANPAVTATIYSHILAGRDAHAAELIDTALSAATL